MVRTGALPSLDGVFALPLEGSGEPADGLNALKLGDVAATVASLLSGDAVAVRVALLPSL